MSLADLRIRLKLPFVASRFWCPDGVRTPPISPLQARAFRVLRALIERDGQAVDRQILMEAAWSKDEIVNERSLNNLIVKLRQVIEDDPSSPSVISSIHGVGYRLKLRTEP